MKYYHMIIERLSCFPGEGTGPDERREYISTVQGSAPPGWRCIGVCGYHEKPREVLHPCIGCVYYAACGSSTRTEPCEGRMTKRQAEAAGQLP